MDLIAQLYIKVDGKNVSEEIMDDLISIEVDNSLHLPDMFSIHLRDHISGSGYKWMDSKTFDLGKPVVITADPQGEEQKGELISGEITAIEPEFIEDIGATVLIRGYDKSHRLHRVKRTECYTQMSDSDIVRRIVADSRCGLQADVESTSPVHEYVIQYNQTDMEFIQDRARRNGYFTYVDDNKLVFRSKPATSGSGPVLKYGKNLRDLQIRLTAAEQIAEAQVRWWNISQEKADDIKEGDPSILPEIGHGGKKAKKAFGWESLEPVIKRPVYTKNEAQAIAKSAINEKCNAFCQAEGTCDGNPEVCAGAKVKLDKIGDKFSGSYYVTRAIHRYDGSGYTTKFEISGYRANTLGELLSHNNKGSRWGGVIRGVVTDNNDEEGLGRVKVQYTGISDEFVSHWARLVTPGAGPERGIEFLPQIDDEVLVAFEYDDFNYPYILGGLWNGWGKPPLATDGQKKMDAIDQRIIKSRSGHTITFDDTDEKEKISIISKSGHTITLDDTSGEEKVSIIDNTTKNTIEINTKDKTLTINTEGDIIMEAKGNVTLKGKDITVEATGNAKVKASSNLDLEASSKATVKANTGVDVQASGQVNVKGATINLN